MSNLREDFIQKLRGVMHSTGRTVQDLANQLDVPYTTLQGWLTTEKFPRPETYDRVMEVLGRIETPKAMSPDVAADSNITLTVRRQRRQKRADLKGIVRISEEAEMALWRLKEQTGLSLRTIASELITQAAAVVRIEEVNEE